MRKPIGILLCTLLALTSCGGMVESDYKLYGDIMSDFIPEVGEVKLLFKHSLEETVGDDGEDYFYNYCPSIKVENDVMHAYYCTNKLWGNVTDYIGYRQGIKVHTQQWSKVNLSMIMKHIII